MLIKRTIQKPQHFEASHLNGDELFFFSQKILSFGKNPLWIWWEFLDIQAIIDSEQQKTGCCAFIPRRWFRNHWCKIMSFFRASFMALLTKNIGKSRAANWRLTRGSWPSEKPLWSLFRTVFMSKELLQYNTAAWLNDLQPPSLLLWLRRFPTDFWASPKGVMSDRIFSFRSKTKSNISFAQESFDGANCHVDVNLAPLLLLFPPLRIRLIVNPWKERDFPPQRRRKKEKKTTPLSLHPAKNEMRMRKCTVRNLSTLYNYFL